MKMNLRDGVAVVTGAASGIGAATAAALAARGCHLALVDRAEVGLGETARRAEAAGVRVTRHLLDVTDPAAVDALPAEVEAAHGRVTVLVNNAGVSLVGRFDELSQEDFRWLFEINFFAVVALTRGFLPLLLRQPRARLVTVSSLFGIIAPAEQTAYAASKFAVRGFSEALRHELAGTGVGVTVVHPGGVRTAIATSGRVGAGADPEAAAATTEAFTRLLLRLPAAKAGEAIARAVERGENRLLIGVDARVGDLMQRAMPATYWNRMRARFEAFKERSLRGRVAGG
jgi:short-subunit dehydrogenase